MSLRTDVADFLLSDNKIVKAAIQKLNFSLDGMRIDPEGYDWMGHLMRQDGIHVEGHTGNAGSPVAAAYTPGRDLLAVAPDLDLTKFTAKSIGQQAAVIHEVTHALFDFHGYQCTNAVEEAAAYIAEAIYAKDRMLQRSSRDDLQTQAILTTSQNVVDKRDMTTKLGQKLRSTDKDVKALVEAVRAHTLAYPDADSDNHSDGIFGGLMNPWYPSSKFG